MLVLIALLLALVPAAAILYPFLRRRKSPVVLEDESSPRAELGRRWEGALAGLKSAELEKALGNLAEQDYLWLREQYMAEAATVLKGLELEEQEEAELLEQIQQELRRIRQQVPVHTEPAEPAGEDGKERPDD